MERGTYVLIVSLDRDCLITVGKLGQIRFRSGIYAYCGSAMAGYRSRVGRHFSQDKKLHWHIDYLLEEAEPIGAFLVQGGDDIECVLSRITVLPGRFRTGGRVRFLGLFLPFPSIPDRGVIHSILDRDRSRDMSTRTEPSAGK